MSSFQNVKIIVKFKVQTHSQNNSSFQKCKVRISSETEIPLMAFCDPSVAFRMPTAHHTVCPSPVASGHSPFSTTFVAHELEGDLADGPTGRVHVVEGNLSKERDLCNKRKRVRISKRVEGFLPNCFGHRHWSPSRHSGKPRPNLRQSPRVQCQSSDAKLVADWMKNCAKKEPLILNGIYFHVWWIPEVQIKPIEHACSLCVLMVIFIFF